MLHLRLLPQEAPPWPGRLAGQGGEGEEGSPYLVGPDVHPAGAPVLAQHLGEHGLQEGQCLGDVGVKAVGEALHLPQVPVLVVLQDELRERRGEGEEAGRGGCKGTRSSLLGRGVARLPPRAQRSAPTGSPPACCARPGPGSFGCLPHCQETGVLVSPGPELGTSQSCMEGWGKDCTRQAGKVEKPEPAWLRSNGRRQIWAPRTGE